MGLFGAKKERVPSPHFTIFARILTRTAIRRSCFIYSLEVQRFGLLEPFQAARHGPIFDPYRPLIAKNAMNGAQPLTAQRTSSRCLTGPPARLPSQAPKGEAPGAPGTWGAHLSLTPDRRQTQERPDPICRLRPRPGRRNPSRQNGPSVARPARGLARGPRRSAFCLHWRHTYP